MYKKHTVLYIKKFRRKKSGRKKVVEKWCNKIRKKRLLQNIDPKTRESEILIIKKKKNNDKFKLLFYHK